MENRLFCLFSTGVENRHFCLFSTGFSCTLAVYKSTSQGCHSLNEMITKIHIARKPLRGSGRNKNWRDQGIGINRLGHSASFTLQPFSRECEFIFAKSEKTSFWRKVGPISSRIATKLDRRLPIFVRTVDVAHVGLYVCGFSTPSVGGLAP